MDGTGGCRIVYGGVESPRRRSVGSDGNTSLQKQRGKEGRRGLGPWPLRCLSQTLFLEKIECIDGWVLALKFCLPFTVGVAMYL